MSIVQFSQFCSTFRFDWAHCLAKDGDFGDIVVHGYNWLPYSINSCYLDLSIPVRNMKEHSRDLLIWLLYLVENRLECQMSKMLQVRCFEMEASDDNDNDSLQSMKSLDNWWKWFIDLEFSLARSPALFLACCGKSRATCHRSGPRWCRGTLVAALRVNISGSIKDYWAYMELVNTFRRVKEIGWVGSDHLSELLEGHVLITLSIK